jgi:hypothetical protein
MIAQYQVLSVSLTISQIILAPLMIGLVVALASRSVRRTIIVAAITAATLVFVGVALVDAVTGLRGPLGYLRTMYNVAFGFFRLYYSELILSVGLSLSFAAVILGLRETARMRRWGWFFAFLLTEVAAGIGTTLFYLTFASNMFNALLIQRFYEGDLTISIPYYLLTSLLLSAVPLAALLFATIGIPHAETDNSVGPAQPAPMPPVAPSTTPNQPYTAYPPIQ